MTNVKNQTKLNIAVSVVYQLTAALCSLILPRYILLTFGSDVNGILQSVSQLLNYTILMECGIGGLITVSFYKPLAEGDREFVSDIFNNAKGFFNKISYVYIGLVAVLAFSVKLFIHTEFDFGYVCTLVVILGINYYFSYYFAMAQRLLLRADQKIRIVQGIQSVTLVLNTVFCIVAMKLGAGIHLVKILNALIFLINPIAFRIYVRKHYSISGTLYDEKRNFPRKTDCIVHYIAFFVHMNTDIVLLSVVGGTKDVSVYSVYNSVIYAIESFFTTVSDSISAAIGNMIAKGEEDNLKAWFEVYQVINTAAATFVCVMESLLIIPFVRIYTNGVTDAVYIRPVFAYMMIAAQWFFCIRLPYNNMINSAGHYRQTKTGAYLEVILNIGISILTVYKFGLCGVAFGTLVAMAARTGYMAWYLSKNLLNRKIWLFIKDTALNLAFAVILIWVTGKTVVISADNLLVWAIYAAAMSVCIIAVIVVFNVIVHNKSIVFAIKKFKKS